MKQKYLCQKQISLEPSRPTFTWSIRVTIQMAEHECVELCVEINTLPPASLFSDLGIVILSVPVTYVTFVFSFLESMNCETTIRNRVFSRDNMSKKSRTKK